MITSGISYRLRMIAMALVFAFAASLAHAQNFVDIKPSPQQVEWQDLEFGVLVHFGTIGWLGIWVSR